MKRPFQIGAGVAGIAALCALAMFQGCSGCNAKATLAYVPGDAQLVVMAPNIKEALTQTKAVLDKFRDNLLVAQGLTKQKGTLVKELGFDPEKPETLKEKGVNPESGLAVSMDADGESVSLVLGVSDPMALEKYLREMITKNMGAGATFKEKDFSGVKVTLVGQQGSERAMAAWAQVKKYVIICPRALEDKVGEYVAKVSRLEKNITANKRFTALQDKMGKNQIFVYLDGESLKKSLKAQTERKLKGSSSKWMKKYTREKQEEREAFLAYLQAAGISIFLSAKGVVLRGYLALPPERGKELAAIFKGKGDPVEFGKYISPDALALGRLSLDPKKLMDRLLEMVPPRSKRKFYKDLERFEGQTKFKLEEDVLALLSGRYAGALFAPSPEAFASGPPRSDKEILGYISGLAMVQVTDSSKASDLLVRLERAMVMDRVEVRIKTQGKYKIYYIDKDGKRLLAWTVANNVVVVGTGDRLAKALTLMAGKGDNVLEQISSSKAKGAFKSDEGIVLYYNLQKSSEMIQTMNIPGALKLLMAPVTSMLEKLSDVTYSVDVKEEGIMGEVALRLK